MLGLGEASANKMKITNYKKLLFILFGISVMFGALFMAYLFENYIPKPSDYKSDYTSSKFYYSIIQSGSVLCNDFFTIRFSFPNESVVRTTREICNALVYGN